VVQVLDNQSRVVVVLGMHRSGSSAMARGLEALGISVGDHLLPAAEDNARGFWEDEDFLALNEQLLKALGLTWHSLRPVPMTALENPVFDGLHGMGLEFIADRNRRHRYWGFKDPRTSRLLGFWLPLLESKGCETHALITIRHPVAIVRSLASRDRMDEYLAVLLCLVYWVPMLRESAGLPSLYVDYDLLLERPEKEMERVANWLGCSPSSADVNDFAHEFLSVSLRHAVVTEQDEERWLERGGCFAQLIKLYKQMRELAEGGRSFTIDYSEAQTLLDSLGPTLSYQDALYDALHEPSLNKLMGEISLRDKEIGRLGAVVELSSRELMELSERNEQMGQELAKYRNLAREQSVKIEEQSVKIEEQSVKIEEQSVKIEEQSVKIEEQSVKIEEQSIEINERTSELADLRMHISTLGDELEQRCLELRNITDHSRWLHGLLEKERYSITKPLLRLLYHQSARFAKKLPTPVRARLRNLKRHWLPEGAFGPVPAFPQAASFDKARGLFQIPEGEGYDVIVFPVIDWYFRVQRPQHLARGLGQRGHRVFYLTTTFKPKESGFEILENPAENVYICQLAMPFIHPNIYEELPDEEQCSILRTSLEALFSEYQIKQTVSLVDHPFWHRLARGIPGSLVVYDCMDDHAGFSNHTEAIRDGEQELFKEADVVVTTSLPLSEKVAAVRENVLIRNAAEVDFFACKPALLYYKSERPVIGYFGAISEWFDIKLIVAAARHYPDYDFLLIGSTYGCDIKEAETLPNIIFVGEVPYPELPGYLYAFDVCLIPFRLVELILCTNPVKMYEYLAAGKPVVATAMPEVKQLSDYIYISESEDAFIANIDQALKEANCQELIEKRQIFARQHCWSNRINILESEISHSLPLVSVIVLTYNNLEFTQACLNSLEEYTYYSNWELVLVDNASTDGTPEFLKQYAAEHAHVHLILNDENLGFAAGNNAGLAVATGEYLVVLNNDTYVTPGWMLDLIRHFRDDPKLGLVGPVTSNIGNEAKIDIHYINMIDMIRVAREYTARHIRERLYVNNVAFFCVAIPRAVFDEVGFLDEAFGVGFFEDDDYCMRVRQSGYYVAIADNVFVHHHLSASFSKVGDEKKRMLFEKNKMIYEDKWGSWVPHKYRDP